MEQEGVGDVGDGGPERAVGEERGEPGVGGVEVAGEREQDVVADGRERRPRPASSTLAQSWWK